MNFEKWWEIISAMHASCVERFVSLQVYLFKQQGGNNFSTQKLSSSIPVNIDKSKFSVDGVKVITANNLTHLLVRSQTNASRIYYSYQNQTTGVWSAFEAIADDKNHLQYDFDVAFNGFVKVFV